MNQLYDLAGETGTEVENDANALAGILMRDYGRLNLDVYQLNEQIQRQSNNIDL